jgi:predicted transcriptional regulator of viral defense system/very-short-patch-repair endonuclease
VFDLSGNSSQEGRTPPDAALAELALRQHGVVTTAQLQRLGWDTQAIKYRARNGRLHRIHRGVYAVGHRHLSDNALFIAAVLAIGADAALSHLSAAALLAIRAFNRNQGTWVDVTVARRVKPRRGIRLHTVRALPPEDVTTKAGIRTTTPARTLIDLADVLTEKQLKRAVHEAEVQRLITPDQLAERLANAPGRRGASRLAAIIALGPAPTRSELEEATLDFLHRHGFPRPRTNASVAGEEVDFSFPGTRVVIEADSYRYHGTNIRHQIDRAKQARLEAAGCHVLRVDWHQVTKYEDETEKRLAWALRESGPAAA